MLFSSVWGYSVIVSLGFYFMISVKFWMTRTRLKALLASSANVFRSAFPQVMLVAIFVASVRYLYMMALANLPMYVAPMMFYSYVLFNAALFWLPIVCYALYTNPKAYVAHMLPHGAPLGLMLLLPLVEIFSQLIRPLTLTIRFATNLSAGHIMMFMFSYFSLLSATLAPFLHVVLAVLLVMEIFIAFLQSYIFMTLLGLYLEETL